MAKIAHDSCALNGALARRALDGGPGRLTARVLAEGPGWSVSDMICTAGPEDRPFEERHPYVFIGLVVAGAFQYRSPAGCELLTPGSLMLGNPEQCFECRHEHGTGDRCVSFVYSPDYFERLAASAGAGGLMPGFRVGRLPALPALSPWVARACAGLVSAQFVSWEELGVQAATLSMRLAHGLAPDARPIPRSSEAEVAAAIRTIDRGPDAALTLASLAREAGLSPYHFLRAFKRVAGVTPHQYVLRARLRDAAIRLSEGRARVLDVAFDCGFADVSNFNRAFRREFGVSPRVYQTRSA